MGIKLGALVGLTLFQREAARVGFPFRVYLSWATLSVVTLVMAWIRSSLLASSFFFISLVSLRTDRGEIFCGPQPLAGGRGRQSQGVGGEGDFRTLRFRGLLEGLEFSSLFLSGQLHHLGNLLRRRREELS